MELNEDNSRNQMQPDIASSIDLTDLSNRDSQIIQLYQKGKSSYQIADELEINRHTVSKVLKDNDIATRTSAFYRKKAHKDIIRLFKKGMSIRKISQIADVTEYTVKKVLEEHKLIFSKSDKDIITIARYIGMKNKGYSNYDIAAFLQLTTKQLNKLVRNSGISVSIVRRKTEKIENLADIVIKKLQGMKIRDIALEYKYDIVILRDVLSDFGLT